jgi:hypothetical protein
MTDQDGLIRCPKCSNAFAITAAMTDSIESKLRAKYDAQAAQLQSKIDADRKKLAADLELLQREKQSVEEVIKQKLDLERKKLSEEEAKKASASVQVIVEQLRTQLDQSRQQLQQSQKAELELRLKQESIEQMQKEMDLQLARARDEAKQLAAKAKDEEFRLKEADHQRQMDQVKKQLDEAIRKAEQGSQQHQGETLECDLELELRKAFPTDEILEVKKGERGADLKQVVRSEQSYDCGVIQWEFKRTKAWNDGWIDKARSDRMASKAHAAVIVTTAPPKDFCGMARIREVWVVSPALLVPTALAIRLSLLNAAQIRRSYDGKHDKQSELYDYIMGEEFAARVKHIVDTFVAMKKQIDDERKAFEKQWAAREKMIDLILKNTQGLAGHISAIGGRDMQSLDGVGAMAMLEAKE